METNQVEVAENGSDVTVRGILPKELVRAARGTALEALRTTRTIAGFRPGKAPDACIEREVGGEVVWREAAREAFMKQFPMLLAKERLAPLGRPKLAFEAVVPEEDVSFVVQFSVMPRVTLPQYRELAAGVAKYAEPEPVSDGEVGEVVQRIRMQLQKEQGLEEQELPPLTDAVVQGISKEYTDVRSFTESIRNTLQKNKEQGVRDKRRGDILHAIMEQVSLHVPNIVIEEEMHHARARLEEEAKVLGTTIAAYQKERGLSEQEFEEELREQAKKRATTQMVLSAIAQQEHIEPDQEMVAREVTRLERRADHVSRDAVHVYVHTLLKNEATMRFLEGLAKE